MTDKPKQPAKGDAARDKNEDTAEDENRRRFKEALARKQHQSGVAKSGHGPDRQGLPSGNDKRRQEFRRKSGG